MLLTETAIYLLVFTKRKRKQLWPSTFSLHLISGLFLLVVVVVGGGGVFGLRGPEVMLLLAVSSLEYRGPYLAVSNNRATRSLEMV